MRYAFCDNYLNVQEWIHMYVCVYDFQTAARPKNWIAPCRDSCVIRLKKRTENPREWRRQRGVSQTKYVCVCVGGGGGEGAITQYPAIAT